MITQHFPDVYEDLMWRNALAHVTPRARHFLKRHKITCYNGFDPTSDTLHIGNLLPLVCLQRLQQYGHKPIAILGGGTGMIGDPSGRADERSLLSVKQIDENAAKIRVQLESFLDFKAKKNPAKLINNAEWLRSTDLLVFLRDIGKHFNVNSMLKRESVTARMHHGGISFTEFSYALLQAYDFLWLYDNEQCTFQSGGTDQWGNILDGIDLIRRKRGGDRHGGPLAHGIVFPLITDSKGDKLGKSIGGAPALDPEKFSPFRLFQFFVNTHDEDVVRFLKLFTTLSREDIIEIEQNFAENKRFRYAQRRLARAVTEQVHGVHARHRAEVMTRALFRNKYDDLSWRELEDVFRGYDAISVPKSDIANRNTSVEQLAVSTGIARSLSDARRMAAHGGLYLNSERVLDATRLVTPEDLLHGNLIVLRRGRREHRLIRVL